MKKIDEDKLKKAISNNDSKTAVLTMGDYLSDDFTAEEAGEVYSDLALENLLLTNEAEDSYVEHLEDTLKSLNSLVDFEQEVKQTPA